MIKDYSNVTEIGEEMVSSAQIERLAQRYYWAGKFCKDKDVLEVACGAGQGLGYIQSVSKSIRAGDITSNLVTLARDHYGERISVYEMNAEQMPFKSESLDVIILFEAIYYLSDVERFISECKRLLRTDGIILLATANKDLFDFNPSPFSTRYFNPPELSEILSKHGFETEFYGGSSVYSRGFANKLIRLVKKFAVTFGLIPRSMRGKRWIKRIVFGKLVQMPKELKADNVCYVAPVRIDKTQADYQHQVLYCVARLG